MASTINTNIISINAQRNLALSSSSLATSMQRLSSGLRVNSAKDDAAGLAIAERMNTQVRGLSVASRNANDGISLAQTAEGALGKVGDMLQRMRELAVQAGNATNSQSDRQALQAEVKQLSAEIDRVAKQTNFNGRKLLEGSFAGAVFQVGANAGDNITLGSLADTRASQLSSVSYASYERIINTSDDPMPSIAHFNEPIEAGTLTITIQSTPPLMVPLERIEPAHSSEERLGQIVEAINNKSADTGVTAYLTKQADDSYRVETMSSKLDASHQALEFNLQGFSATTTGIVLPPKTIDYSTYGPVANAALNVSTPPALSNQQIFEITVDNHLANNPILSAIFNSNLTQYKQDYDSILNNYETTKNVTNANELTNLLWTAGNDYEFMVTAKYTFDHTTPKDLTAANTYVDALRRFETGIWGWTSPSYTNLADAMKEINAKDPALFPFGVLDYDTNQQGIDDIDVSTQSGAWVALKKIDSAIDQVNSARATLGAMQSRFENAVNNIDIQSENLSAARGRIVDADFAKETANLARTQILQQAGMAMVAQANQIPQNVLQLLKGG